MKCFKIHRIRRVHHQNSITFFGAKPAQKSADILIKNSATPAYGVAEFCVIFVYSVANFEIVLFYHFFV